MSNLEHYFENLLFLGKDVNGDWNKNSLTKEEQNAVEECAQYVLYSLFCGRDELKKVLEFSTVDAEPVRHGHWVTKWNRYDKDGYVTQTRGRCSCCNQYSEVLDYCGNCGAKMDEVTDNG